MDKISSLPPSLLVLASEAILSFYPILIKTVPTNLTTQWFARFLTFPLLAYIMGSKKDIPITWDWTTFWAGALNMLHIGASYLSFYILPAGVALSLFYLYPLFNVLAGGVFFGEPLSLLTIGLVLLATFGVYLLAKDKDVSPSSLSPSLRSPFAILSSLSPSTLYMVGMICAILAALTETFLYVFVRWNKNARQSPYYAIYQFYPVGLLCLLLYLGFQPSALDTNLNHLIYLFGFNALIGFTGYATRFYTIPKVSTLIFSLLSFVGVVFGYMWSNLFTTDKTSSLSWIGSGLIVLSVFMMRYLFSKES